MVLDAHLTLTSQRARLERAVPEDGEGDHLVKNAAELVAAANVADDHVTGIDNPEPFVVRGRLADLAQAAQSIMPIMRRGGVSSWTASIGALP